MPTYKFRCISCGNEQSHVHSMKSLDTLKENMVHCGHKMMLVIQAPRAMHLRSPFPSEPFEHADYEPRAFRDKYELLDHCEEAGLKSRLLEDGDVP